MLPRQNQTRVKPHDYGYVSGYKDRHRITTAEEHIHSMSTAADCLEWLAGWREGQAHRRRDDPDTMGYPPLWPSQAIALKKGRNKR